MRLLILSLGCAVTLAGAARAQTDSSENSSRMELPVGQIYKHFQFPQWQDGKLKFTLSAEQAKGRTLNRAEMTDLKIDLYDDGKVTTTITSPKADIYVDDRKMRTDNTVQIERPDLEATAKICEFDLISKQYLLRTNVRVVLKHFDAGLPGKGTSGKPVPGQAISTGLPKAAMPSEPHPVPARDDSLLDSPGAYSNTNSTPLPQ